MIKSYIIVFSFKRIPKKEKKIIKNFVLIHAHAQYYFPGKNLPKVNPPKYNVIRDSAETLQSVRSLVIN